MESSGSIVLVYRAYQWIHCVNSCYNAIGSNTGPEVPLTNSKYDRQNDATNVFFECIEGCSWILNACETIKIRLHHIEQLCVCLEVHSNSNNWTPLETGKMQCAVRRVYNCQLSATQKSFSTFMFVSVKCLRASMRHHANCNRCFSIYSILGACNSNSIHSQAFRVPNWRNFRLTHRAFSPFAMLDFYSRQLKLFRMISSSRLGRSWVSEIILFSSLPEHW